MLILRKIICGGSDLIYIATGRSPLGGCTGSDRVGQEVIC